MLDRPTALSKLKAARDVFWFSLGAYALLTEEPSRSELPNFRICVTERNRISVSRELDPAISETSYTIGFNAGLDRVSALTVVDFSFRQMLIESFQVSCEYAKSNSLGIKHQPWYEFARHYRNAVAHNGKWHFDGRRGLPTTWRNRTVEVSMQGQSISGFLSWFEGLQLGAQMNLFVSGVTP